MVSIQESEFSSQKKPHDATDSESHRPWFVRRVSCQRRPRSTNRHRSARFLAGNRRPACRPGQPLARLRSKIRHRWPQARQSLTSRHRRTSPDPISSVTSACQARFRSHAAYDPTCTAAAPGRCGSTQGSPPQPSQTAAFATSCRGGSAASASPSISQRRSATTRIIPWRPVRSVRWVLPSTRSRTWRRSSTASRSSVSRRR